MLLLFTGGSGSGPAVASYPLDDDGTLAAAFGFGWLETDAPDYWNADYTYLAPATGNLAAALPTAANAWTSQAIVVDTGTILACEAVINSVSAAQFANLGMAAAFSSGGTPSGTAVINSIDNNGSPRWLVSGTGGTRARSGATSGYRVGIELNGNDGTITMRSSDGSALCSTTFTPGTAFTFYLFATDAGTPAAGQTASITLVPVGADMQLCYTTGATDFNGDPCPQGYATWNPADKDDSYTLSGGNLIATKTSTGWESLRATIAIDVRSYFELTFSNIYGYSVAGIDDLLASLATFVGGDSHGWGYYGQTGSKTNSGGLTSYGNQFANVTIGIDFDPDSGVLNFQSIPGYREGPIATSGLTGGVFPAASALNEGDTITLNAGQSPFVYPVPEGARAGVYTS